MALEQRMQQTLRQQQKLVMTPMMQQAIKLLQLSTIELQDLIQQEMVENMVLEDETTPEAQDTTEGGETVPELEDSLPVEAEGVSGEQPDLSRGEIDITAEEFEAYFADTSEVNDYTPPTTYEANPDGHETQIASHTTLKDHLLRQLHILATDEQDISVGERIIDLIDDNGYFLADIAIVAEETGVDVAQAERVLQLVQSMDPPGIGARNITECLLLQLRAQENFDPLLFRAISEHLEDLERKRYAVVARSLGITEQRAQELADAVSAFEPYPGREYSTATPEYIVPDVFIERVNGEWQVRVNDDNTPPLRISRRYRQMLQDRENLSQQEYEFILDKFRSARWLIRNIEQRKQTLYKVTRYIADVQRDFLEHGISHLRPLRYRDVADGVGIHEATVCRVVNNKYVQTPRGLFELKFFFSTGLEGSGGEDQSAKSVMEKIRELIDAEDARKPLSDQKITEMLSDAGAGVNISRRTVAKYRQKMGILPAHQRKRV